MKSKLLFRVLGALASALIIASVFIPFVNVLGYTQSLWEAYSITEIYLPIMIIVFGGVGVFFFAINIKTEFAYSTSGALLFYIITETFSFVKQDMFDSLGIGYYCLLVGTIVTGIMAFLCNLRTKKLLEPKQISSVNEEPSVLNQIDKLYDEQNTNNLEQNTDSLDNIIQPLPITNIEPIIQPQETQPIMEPQVIEQPEPLSNLVNIENNITETQPIVASESVVEVKSIMEPQLVQRTQPIIETQVIEQPEFLSNIGEVFTEQVQPVSISQMNNNTVVANPVVAEFGVPVENTQEQAQSFFTPEPQQNIEVPEQDQQAIEPNLFAANQNAIESTNPVISEFTNQPNKMFSNQEVQPVNNVSTPASNSSNLDIFN